jgi:hypothetical protein
MHLVGYLYEEYGGHLPFMGTGCFHQVVTGVIVACRGRFSDNYRCPFTGGGVELQLQ